MGEGKAGLRSAAQSSQSSPKLPPGGVGGTQGRVAGSIWAARPLWEKPAVGSHLPRSAPSRQRQHPHPAQALTNGTGVSSLTNSQLQEPHVTHHP